MGVRVGEAVAVGEAVTDWVGVGLEEKVAVGGMGKVGCPAGVSVGINVGVSKPGARVDRGVGMMGPGDKGVALLSHPIANQARPSTVIKHLAVVPLPDIVVSQ